MQELAESVDKVIPNHIEGAKKVLEELFNGLHDAALIQQLTDPLLKRAEREVKSQLVTFIIAGVDDLRGVPMYNFTVHRETYLDQQPRTFEEEITWLQNNMPQWMLFSVEKQDDYRNFFFKMTKFFGNINMKEMCKAIFTRDYRRLLVILSLPSNEVVYDFGTFIYKDLSWFVSLMTEWKRTDILDYMLRLEYNMFLKERPLIFTEAGITEMNRLFMNEFGTLPKHMKRSPNAFHLYLQKILFPRRACRVPKNNYRSPSYRDLVILVINWTYRKELPYRYLIYALYWNPLIRKYYFAVRKGTITQVITASVFVLLFDHCISEYVDV